MLNFNVSEIVKLNRLIYVATAIYHLYENLWKLELKNTNNSVYNKILEKIKYYKEEEQKIIDELCISVEQIEKYLDCLGIDYFEAYDLIEVFNNKKSNIYYRLSEKMNQKYIELSNDITLIPDMKGEYHLIESNTYHNMVEYNDIDYQNTILALINECLNNEEMEEYKSRFLKLKYLFYYRNDFLENKMINKEEEQDTLYWLCDFYADYKQIPESVMEMVRTSTGRNIIAYCYQSLNNISKSDDFIAILLTLSIRTAFLFLDNEFVNILEDSLDNYITKENIEEDSEKILRELFVNHEKDINMRNIVRGRRKDG